MLRDAVKEEDYQDLEGQLFNFTGLEVDTFKEDAAGTILPYLKEMMGKGEM
jgi:hypothetical protein